MIQIPSFGTAIALGPDNPTVGGYPVIATVIEADLPALAQRPVGSDLRFVPVSIDQARDVSNELESLIASIPRAHEPVHVLCDTGEAESEQGRGAERAMLPYVTAVAIACGGHAGDEGSMRDAVHGALDHGCVIGAHPAFPDRAGFGRRPLAIPTDIKLEDLLGSSRAQIESLRCVCDGFGDRSRAHIAFIKPHGALYHAMSSDMRLAKAFARVVLDLCPDAALVCAAGSPSLNVWESMGADVWPEVFADRAYSSPDCSSLGCEDLGGLRPRSEPGSVITDPAAASAQALRLRAHARAVCVHGDTPGASGIAQAVSAAVLKEGWPVR